MFQNLGEQTIENVTPKMKDKKINIFSNIFSKKIYYFIYYFLHDINGRFNRRGISF